MDKEDGRRLSRQAQHERRKHAVRGRGYQPKGQTPLAHAVGGTRHKLSMIPADTNQGQKRWMVIDEAFNIERLIEFLEALIQDAPKKVFLILDNLRVPTA